MSVELPVSIKTATHTVRENADGSMTITACGPEKWALSKTPVAYSAKTVFRDALNAPGIVTVTWEVQRVPDEFTGLLVIDEAQRGSGLKDAAARVAAMPRIAPPPARDNLTPAELRRMRTYHAALLGRPVEQLERDRIGENRWTRRDLAAVDAVLAERARREKVRAVAWVALGVACGLVGEVLAIVLTSL